MQEVWRPVYGFVGLYEMSTRGRVMNPRTGKILKPRKNRYGYLLVNLWKDGVKRTCTVHRLVGMTFPDLVGWTEDAKGRPFEELEINHKDENKENNRVENLEWCDEKYNQTYSNGKTVYQYTFGNQLVNVWPSAKECKRHGFDDGNIVRCCNNKQKSYKGFKWSHLPLSC